jgi:hypothetical protein
MDHGRLKYNQKKKNNSGTSTSNEIWFEGDYTKLGEV